jgi:N-carbamoylputrescine amidase
MAKQSPPPARASSVVRIGLVQAKASEDPRDNLKRTLAAVESAAKQGAKLVCTQELFRSRYFCQTEDAANFALAEDVPGPTTEALARVAKKHGIVVIGSLFERRAPGLYHNTTVILDADGSLVGAYRKMHIPDDPRFYEKYYFTPGDADAGPGFRAWDTAVGRIGVLICWDQWYPEGARITALDGAKILFYPTAIGTWQGEAELEGAHRDAWRTIQRSHAIANGVFVAAVNRVGREDELRFWGSSFVARPYGQLLAEASQDREEILLADCDLDEIERTRQGWPFLRDRRIDAYPPILERYLHDPHHRGGSDCCG